MTSYSNQSKNSSTWDKGYGYLLKEDAFYLLLETGDRILLDDSQYYRKSSTYTNLSKS